MTDQFVPLKHLADEFGMDRSHARRYVIKLGLTPHRRRTASSGGQLTLALTSGEAEMVRARRREEGFLGSSKPVETGVGVFYVIQLVPDLDSKHFKLGFAEDVSTRLAQHRTAAPTARVVKSWPRKRSWESTVMDALSAVGCRLILNEVFECDDLDALLKHGDALFALLLEPARRPELSDLSRITRNKRVRRHLSAIGKVRQQLGVDRAFPRRLTIV